MKEKTFQIPNKLGMHARAINLFVSAAGGFISTVRVSKVMKGEEVVVNGKSMINMMALEAAFGERVKVIVEGQDEDEAMKVIEDLFDRKFDED